MLTVTYLSPLRVCRQRCSSTPRSRTPSKRAGSPIRTRRPWDRTASLAVVHATPQAFATIICLTCGLLTFTICVDGCLVTLFVSVASLDSCVTCYRSRRAPGHEIVAIMSLAVI